MATAAVDRREARVVPVLGRLGTFVLVLAALWGAWEGYKWLWETTGWTWPFLVDDTTMPHIHDILNAFREPVTTGGPALIHPLLDAAWFTAKEALAGFVLGAVVGFGLAVLLVHSRLLERGLLPYIVASQTVPILAVAPMVVIGLGSKGVEGWKAVAILAAYLTFFPVAINSLRGLQSADPRAFELMESYATSRWSVLWRLRVPASLPYLFTALKISATASVIGAIIGETPASIQEGLGGAIVNFNQYYSLQPTFLWATNIVCAVLGLVLFGLVGPDRASRATPGAGALRVNGTGESVVSIQGLTKSFRTGVTALQDIDLEIAPGEFVSLIGPSGCGKSTLLRIVGDLIQPSSGTLAVNGKSAHQARLDHDYGIVFQDAVLYDWRTVARNVALPLELLGWDRARRRQRVDEMLDLVELTGFESSRPWQLSGGMQQRVSIARALSFDPALLLMDEPFGALDEMTRERLNMELLRIWEKSGSTVVFVTHSIPEAVFLSTRVVVMSARPGRIADTVEVDLPQPRTGATREEPRFFELVTAVREALAAGHGDAAGGRSPTVEELF